MSEQHLEPCAACPLRLKSAPGWLGSSSPHDFARQIEDPELRMPCHLHMDYEDEFWDEQIDRVPQCAGRAAYLRNRCKMPRDPNIAYVVKMVSQRDDVFKTPDAFIDHHLNGLSRLRA